MNTTIKHTIRISEETIMQSGIYMKTDPEGEVKYLQVKDINGENEIDYSHTARVKDTGTSHKYYLRKDDLLFAAKGASNYCFLYDGSKGNIIPSSSFIIIHITSKKILPEFLCCYLNTPSILSKLKNSSVGTGIQMIPQSVIGDLQLEIPSMEVQQLIVQIDRLIKKSEKLHNKINTLKRNLQDQLLMDSLKRNIL